MKKTQNGFSLIELLIVIVIIGIIAAVAVPNLLASRRAANEAAAVGSLRALTGVQATYKSSHLTFGTLPELSSEKLIDEVIGCGTPPCLKTGYNFITAPAATNPDYHWDAYADPEVDSGIGATGYRYFYTNESGVIFARVGNRPNVDGNRIVTNGSPIGN